MTRELVFHLGDRKTGSTSIQAMLRSGKWEADGAPKLCYPARMHNGVIAKSLVGPDPVKSSANAFRNLAARLDSVGESFDVAVVSSEHFEVVPPKNLKLALQAHLPDYAESARFVIYLRPHADRILSSFAERTKLGVFSGTLTEFVATTIESDRYNYFDRIRRWRNVFGDRVVVRPMIRASLHQNCVVRDFLSIALNTQNLKLLEEPAANESLTVRDLSILSLFHREFTSVPMNDKARQAIGRNIGLLFAAHRGTLAARPAYDSALCEKLIATYRADAVELDREFFAGSPMLDALYAARERVAATVTSLIPEDNFAPDELRDLQVLAKMICQMAEIDLDGWPRFFTSARLEEEDDSHPFKAQLDPSLKKEFRGSSALLRSRRKDPDRA